MLNYQGLDYNKTAKEAFGLGTKLKCSQCGNIKCVTTSQIAEYLQYGWPKCCEETMKPMGDRK